MPKLREKIILDILFPIADRLMGLCIVKWYRKIVNMNTWPREDVVTWQQEQLQEFIRHAYDNTAYYRRIFDQRGLKPEDIKCAEDLKLLPTINKDIVMQYYDDIVPCNISHIRHRKARTGGTTGEPMQYLCDENTWGYVTAAKIYEWTRTEFCYGDKFVALGSASLFSKKPSLVRRIYDSMRNEKALNGVNLSDDVCEKYVDFFKKHKIKYLYGYAASIYLLAKYVNNSATDLKQIKVVFTTSEKLTEDYRLEIIKAFQCKVMDCYGAKDAGITAFEHSKGVYPIGYNVIAEIVNYIDDNAGTLITTNFLNYAFPLIRYEFGDEAVLVNNHEDYNGQVLLGITGRTSDVIRLSNGRNITGPGFTVLMKSFDVNAYQIKQLDELSIEVKILPRDTFTLEQEQLLRDTISKFIGVDCVLKIIHVDNFEPLKNGKRRYFMN